MVPMPVDSHRRDLDRIRVRSATFRERTAEERDRFAVGSRRVSADERVLLQTCHRVELVTVDDWDISGLTAVGTDAVRRVFEVVAGFDSAVIAEEQVLGQVREAYESALAARQTGPILNELFRRALRFGRRVRTHATPGADRSLADRAVTWLRDGRTAPGDAGLVAGTGEMGRLAAVRLARSGRQVTVVSGSAERGERLLRLLGGTNHRLALAPVSADDVDAAAAVILAVRGRRPVLTTEHLTGANRPWTVDLSSPIAVDPTAAELLGDRLLVLDRLADVTPRAAIPPGAERRLRAELELEVGRFVTWLVERRAGDALALLHREAEAVRRRHLDRLRGRAGLAPDQLAAVEAASAAMVGELLHGPSVQLRRGGEDAAAVRRLFGLEV